MLINWRDSLNLASKLTLKRIKNAERVYASYLRAKKTGEPIIKGLPISMAIEPTTACNLQCPECPSGLKNFTRPTGKIDPTHFKRIINELAETLIYLTFYFQGEPYLHPDFLQMVRFANEAGIYTATSTNAHFLDNKAAEQTVLSGLNRLIISIDGATQETYEAYRRSGQLDKVIEGTRKILSWKKKLKSRTPEVIWQFLVVRPNEHEIPQIKKMARHIGVQVKFKTAQIYDFAHGNELIPTIEKYSRYRESPDGTFRIKNDLKDDCWKMWHSCVITWDGKVVPCCFDKDAQFVLGNTMNNSSFKDIWNSNEYCEFRTLVLNSRSKIEMCQNCTEGGLVWS